MRTLSFNREMMLAALEGRKTVTRRPILTTNEKADCVIIVDCRYPFNGFDGELLSDENGVEWPIRCPFGEVGEKLWVREPVVIHEDHRGLGFVTGVVGDEKVRVRYLADNHISDWLPYPNRLTLLRVGDGVPNGCYRECARKAVEVTHIAIERIQDITDLGAVAEGIVVSDTSGSEPHRAKFSQIWDQIYKSRGYGWKHNPFVWVVSFQLVDL